MDLDCSKENRLLLLLVYCFIILGGENYRLMANNAIPVTSAETTAGVSKRIDSLIHPLMAPRYFTPSPIPILDSTTNWASSVGFLDNDNIPDLMVNAYEKFVSSKLYSNQRGIFTLQSSPEISKNKSATTTSAIFDIDNDGDADIVMGNNINTAISIYLNDGTGTYQEADMGPITRETGYAHGIHTIDIDNDGYLDLFITQLFPTLYCRLYKNANGKSFSKVTSGNLTTISGFITGAAWGDYDNDGLIDVFIPVGGVSGNNYNLLFKNLGNFNFRRISQGVLVNESANSTAACWGDYDNDGDVDLFVSNASNENNCLYQNLGKGQFQKMNIPGITNDNGHSHGCNWIDVDNDGWLDLYVNNNVGQQQFLYINQRNGTFTKVSADPLVNIQGEYINNVWGDFNMDGFPDVLVSNASRKGNRLFYGTPNDNHWLAIRLKGIESNKSGIGTRVKYKIKVRGKSTWISRSLIPNGGFGSYNTPILHLGLGDENQVDSLVLQWPSGIVQTITKIKADQYVMVEESRGIKISGTTFHDLNRNGNFDLGEKAIGNQNLTIQPGNIRLLSDEYGNYEVTLAPDNYQLFAVGGNYWTPTSSNGTKANKNKSQQIIHFGYVPIARLTDLALNMSSTAKRRGNTSNITLQISNQGTLPVSNAGVRLTLPSGIFIQSSSAPYTQISSNLYEWNIPALGIQQSYQIEITDSIASNLAVGSVVGIFAYLTPILGDQNVLNNFSFWYAQILGALDPNDMAVFLPENKNFPEPGDTVTYRIRFQNNGNLPSNDVVILDTLPVGLLPSSIQIIEASHQYQYSVEGQVLKIHFKDIQLPDSVRYPTLSQGYIIFKIQVAEGVLPGTVISNSATILMDNGEPMTTNLVSFTTGGSISSTQENPLEIKFYPNPVVNQSLTLLTPPVVRSEIEVVIVDLTGKPVYRQAYMPNLEDQIQLPGIPNGPYFLVIRNNQKVQCQPIIIVNGK